MLKAGDIVTIYHDPISEVREEGRARLKRHDNKVVRDEPTEDGELQYWYVQFLDDGSCLYRTIKSPTY